MSSEPLDASKPQSVSYCIPQWLNVEQIKAAIPRVKGRVEPYPECQTRSEPVAIVCFGPSLNQTWEAIKNYEYVITGSGSHKFMIEHGLTPDLFKHWWHLEVDPREHKVGLMGKPDPRIEYLIASCGHPKLFDHLEGMNVKLWHVFTNEEEAFRILPRGEWAVFGGCSVGLRQMTMARFLGFTDLHIFGMDGCEGETGKHADKHPNQAPGRQACEYPKDSGKIYYTTPAFLEGARMTWHELDEMPDTNATFYGEGLVQAMAKDYVRKVKPPAKNKIQTIAVAKPELISAEMVRLNRELHQSNLAYGVGGGRHADTVTKLVKTMVKEDNPFPSVLDYGAGKGYLQKALPFPIFEYDPAMPGKEASPRPADLVVCADTLEHIEPDKLFAVLDDIRRCTKQVAYFVIHMGPAIKTYADGRNTHLIQESREWWEKKIAKFFEIGKVIELKKELHVIVGKKNIKPTEVAA